MSRVDARWISGPGGLIAAAGMLIAVVVTVVQLQLVSPAVMFGGLLVGSALGYNLAGLTRIALLALGAGALLVAGGLVARRIVR